MALLDGSPLGLIGVRSIKNINGFSTFNADKTRNINVTNYNKGKDVYPIDNLTDNTYGGVKKESISEGTRSMFTGPTVIAPYGMIGQGKTDTGALDANSKYIGVDRNKLHNDQIYDTSLLNIIERLSGTEAALRPADFAYLKNVGVYPNNRLMIARRFTKPHLDNIFGVPKSPGALVMATMISWKPQDQDFLEISFGEEWVEASGDFKDVLNSLGKDFLVNSLGDRTGGLAGAIPLPGFTEVLQRQVLTAMGLMEDNPNTPLPSGNPNLIKEAKRRKTIGYEGTGSGLKCTVSIKMECEWEQKFLSGIDPTIVFQDLLNKILVFATSKSSTYGLTKEFEAKVQQWTNDPKSIVTDMITYIKDALAKTVASIQKTIDNLKTDDTAKEKATTAAEEQQGILDTLKKEGETILNKVVQKYKIEIQGIARALTGAPSTPWHITIGNPLRPIFCAGDMYMSDTLTLNLGPTLAFNDLPSSIKASFTLVNARPWGLQEIIAKFNTGSIRVSTTIKDDMQMNTGDKKNATDKAKTGPTKPLDNQMSSINLPATASNTLSTKEQGPGFTGGFGGGGFSGGGAGGSFAANTPAVSNPVSTGAIATVAAGPQSTDNTTKTFANNFGASLPDTSKLTSGISSNIASAQSAVANVQSQVTSGVAGVQGQVTGAINNAVSSISPTALPGLQNAISNAVANATTNAQDFITSNLSAANSSKEGDGITSVMNSVATQVSGVIPFDTSTLGNIAGIA